MANWAVTLRCFSASSVTTDIELIDTMGSFIVIRLFILISLRDCCIASKASKNPLTVQGALGCELTKFPTNSLWCRGAMCSGPSSFESAQNIMYMLKQSGIIYISYTVQGNLWMIYIFSFPMHPSHAVTCISSVLCMSTPLSYPWTLIVSRSAGFVDIANCLVRDESLQENHHLYIFQYIGPVNIQLRNIDTFRPNTSSD